MRRNNELSRLLRGALYITLGSGAFLLTPNANAVPSFARQTGMACMACHTVFPKLTSFGRAFKLNGYTMTGLKQVETKASSMAPALKIDAGAPLSAMLQTALTHVSKPGSMVENDNITFPQALSLYYAGEISPHVGAFIQVTMNGPSGNFGFDMADMRYANSTSTADGTPVTYGVAIDNMPGMGDLWNTTPSWTYPYLDASPDHGDGPVVNSLMGAGLAAYTMIDNHWYAYLADYKPMMNMKVMGGVGNFHANSPYWRLAWQGNVGKDGYLEVGTYGVVTQVYGTTTATSDKYTDTALDAQYELPVGNGNQFSAHAVYIHEAQTLDASNPTVTAQHINQSRADVAYIIGDKYQYQFGYFSNAGSNGAYAYNGDTMTWAAYGGDSNGYVAEFDYIPWENTKLSLQYTAYNKYNGVSGSAASNNNALVANAWFMW